MCIHYNLTYLFFDTLEQCLRVCSRLHNYAKKVIKCVVFHESQKEEKFALKTQNDKTGLRLIRNCYVKLVRICFYDFFNLNKLLNDVYYSKYILMPRMYCCRGIKDAPSAHLMYLRILNVSQRRHYFMSILQGFSFLKAWNQ